MSADENLAMGLPGYTVLVTGATGHVGTEVVCLLARNGVSVGLIDRDAEALRTMEYDLGGGSHFSIPVDLAKADSINELITTARARSRHPLKALIHLAAVLIRRPLHDVTLDDWHLQMDVNLRASFLLSRAFADVLRTEGTSGSVVLAASQGWWTGGMGDSSVYSMTKAGLVPLARGLAREYGSEQIRFNVVAFGAMSHSMRDEQPTEVRSDIMQLTPLKRLGLAGEAAGPAVFLASEWASWINGAVLNVSGGFLSY